MIQNGEKQMHILATNDDGFTAPGLLSLVRAIQFLGDINDELLMTDTILVVEDEPALQETLAYNLERGGY
jgi:hypothetical protein